MKQPFQAVRLNLTTIVLTILLIISCFLSYLLSLDMQKRYEDRAELTFNGNKFIAASAYLTNEVRAYASTENKVHFDNYWNEVDKLKNRALALARMKEIGITNDELKIIEEMSNISNNLIPLESRAMDDVKKGELESAIAYVYGKDYRRDISKINVLKEDFLTTLDNRTRAEVNNITENSNILQIALCLFTLLIIALQIINYLMNKTILNEFERLASIDMFSGLYNRNKYMRTIAKIVAGKADTVGVVYLDINGLKQVNDEYGHEYGDNLILKVVSIMKEYFTHNLFRIGGNEFVALCLNGKRTRFDEKVLQLRNRTNLQTDVSVSIGSTWCTDTNEISRHIAHADELMYVDKQNYYINRQSNQRNYRSTVAAELQNAITSNEFFIVLQPKLRLSDEKIVGAEALVRKKDGQGGLIPPDKFVPIYEADGIIQYIDYYVLELTCQTLKNWKECGHPLMPISVNFSRITILDYKVAEKIHTICKTHNIEAKYIKIELTEHIGNILIENLNTIINEIKSYGYKVSLDDFGREYSNLMALSHVSFDEIKVDKSLIDDIVSKPEICTAMKHLTGMCNSFRKTEMVVEGIETHEQFTLLRGLECDFIGQGYYFSRPLPIGDFLQYCSEQSINN